jgi:hypothetical protein
MVAYYWRKLPLAPLGTFGNPHWADLNVQRHMWIFSLGLRRLRLEKDKN